MSKYNCVNCGAPIDYEQVKCPYCGTYYFDLSEMTVGEIVMLKVNIPHKGKVLARAFLTDFDVTAEQEELPVYNEGNSFVQFVHSPSVTADMHFQFVESKDGNLFTVIKEDAES